MDLNASDEPDSSSEEEECIPIVIVDERAIAIMTKRMESLERVLENIKDRMRQINMPRNPTEPSMRLVIEKQYCRIRLEYDKLWMAVEFAKAKQHNPFVCRKPPLSSIEPDSHVIQCYAEHEETYIDLLPDLTLINVCNNFTDVADVRALFIVIPYRWRVEREFCNQVRACYHLKGFDLAMFKDCPLTSPPCRFPNTCPQCYLYCKGRCTTCKRSTELHFDEPYNTQRCDNLILTEATGLSVKCREMIRCPTCQCRYHPEEAEDVVRIRDFDCEKYPTRVGCIHCVTECKWCANIGCNHAWHYKVNPYVYVPSDSWEECDDCHHPHCCRLFVKYYRQKDDEDDKINEDEDEDDDDTINEDEDDDEDDDDTINEDDDDDDTINEDDDDDEDEDEDEDEEGKCDFEWDELTCPVWEEMPHHVRS